MPKAEITSADIAPMGDQIALVIERQRAAFLKNGPPSPEMRIDRIERAMAAIRSNERRFLDALKADYHGARSDETSALGDIGGSIIPLKLSRDGVRKWMRPEKRSSEAPFGLLGSKLEIHYEPLGVVGILGTWNFPLNTVMSPLGDAFAAGNSCVVKPSEHTPRTAELLTEAVRERFDPDECFAFTGGPAFARAFSAQRWDHLMFTGSTDVGRMIAQEAARNLVPITLEMGGKSPTIIGRDVDLKLVAERIAFAKMFNGGQVCLAPDYCFVPAEHLQNFVTAVVAAFTSMFPTLRDNPDYTGILNQHHYQRLTRHLEEARAGGAEIIEINPAGEDLSGTLKIAPTLILSPPKNGALMQEEIFGPLLPVLTYKTIDEVTDYIRIRPHPLGLYYFGDAVEAERVRRHTQSGGVSINDCAAHVRQGNAPFGGVGESGCGALHGFSGFRNFSHERPVYTQTGIRFEKLIMPPWGARAKKMIASLSR